MTGAVEGERLPIRTKLAFGLGSLGRTDERAHTIGNILHLGLKPMPFNPIPSEKSRSYFLHRPPSYEPVDTE